MRFDIVAEELRDHGGHLVGWIDFVEVELVCLIDDFASLLSKRI